MTLEIEGQRECKGARRIEIRFENSAVLCVKCSKANLHTVKGIQRFRKVKGNGKSKITTYAPPNITPQTAAHQEVAAGNDASSNDHGFMHLYMLHHTKIGPDHHA